MILDKNPNIVTVSKIRKFVDKERILNPKKKGNLIVEQEGGDNDLYDIQDGGVNDDYLAYAKIIPMQISERKNGPNDMVVTITQITNINPTLPTENPDTDDNLKVKPVLKKINISVGDAIQFVQDGKVVYAIICGFKAGKKKYLGGKIESNTNIEDYWKSSDSFIGEDNESALYSLRIDEIISIINLRGIIYV